MNKSSLYKQEHDKLAQYEPFLNSDPNSELSTNFNSLYNHYSELANEAAFIAKYSDRLQKKLTLAHSESVKQNHTLKEKNELLNTTIKELNQAKISNKAATYVIIIAVILFILDEGIFEPWLESKTDKAYITWTFKIGFVLLLKPIEMIIEKYLVLRDRQRILRKHKNKRS